MLGVGAIKFSFLFKLRVLICIFVDLGRLFETEIRLKVYGRDECVDFYLQPYPVYIILATIT